MKQKVLLFDEPTAHLDIETEASLKKDILPVFEDHLVFFATHRLHWIGEMDYVLVMDHGRVVEQGTPDELAKRNGDYVKLRSEMEAADSMKNFRKTFANDTWVMPYLENTRVC